MALRRRAIELTVGRDHAAESAYRIAVPGLLVSGSARVSSDGDTAGIVVLDNGDGGRSEFAHQPIGRVGIGQVVVARRLALDQHGLGDSGRGRGIDIESGGSDGGSRRNAAVCCGSRRPRSGEAAGRPPSPQRDGGRWLRRRRPCARTPSPPGAGASRGWWRRPVVSISSMTACVVRGLDQHRHVLVVLGRCPDHGRAADIDGLDAPMSSAAPSRTASSKG